jgi:hypothetical protein
MIILTSTIGLLFLNKNDTSIETTKEPLIVESQIATVTDYPINFDVLNDNILNAGPPKDGIPPIDNPIYISVSEADQILKDDQPVFIYETLDGVYVYPQNILVWHEIVNDTIHGESLAITYCPLTGSTICYINDPTHEGNTFGTSGNLLNSNLVMYDRSTESYVPQILGIGINNQLKGQELQTRPIHWTRWEIVREHYDHAKVLSEETGFLRDYNKDPYGSYDPDKQDSYYTSGVPFFPLLNENDGTFQDKQIVVGVKMKDVTLAIDPNLVKINKVINFHIADHPALAVWDDQLETVRILSRIHKDETLEFVFDDGLFDQNGDKWQPNGTRDGLNLTTLTYFDVMWFAWHAYYPNTEVIK